MEFWMKTKPYGYPTYSIIRISILLPPYFIESLKLEYVSNALINIEYREFDKKLHQDFSSDALMIYDKSKIRINVDREDYI